MNKRQMSVRSRRLLAALTAGVLAAGVATVIAPPASADPGPVVSRSSSVTADALPTAQIDGVAWKQVVNGNTVYVGGSFTTARPAGSAPGVNTVPRGNLMAYDITTGAIISSFAPSLNGQVKALALSPDGSRLYVGGDFTTADGQNRYRLAAYNTATGALDNNFVAGVDTTVNAIVATNTTVYIGGAFSSANGNPRARLAAFRASDGALLNWAPTAENNSVEAMVMSPDGSKLIVGGSFTTLNGSSSGYGLGALDPNDGSLLPWAAGNTVKDAGTQASILSLYTDGNAIYGSGYVYGPGGNLEGAFSADPSSGNINWIEDCHGDTYGTFANNGTVYTVGHAHDCSTVGKFGQTQPWSYHYSLAWTAKATGTLLANQVGGYANFAGTPSPGMINWFPDYTEGSYTGQNQATWNVSGNSQYVVVGGEFPTVNGVAQQGLVRYAVPSIAPNKQGPQVSGYYYQTTQDQVTATSVRVSWPSNWDRDDQTLKYELIRNGDSNNPVYTTTATSQFWNRPTLSYVDTGLKPATTYQYYVRVTDPNGNAVRGDYTTVTTAAAPPPTPTSAYATQVLSDKPVDYWRLGDPAGSTTAADSAGTSPLAEQSGVTNGTAGALIADSDTADTFSGTSTGFASTTTAIAGPKVFSIEAWFKTTSTTGGKIVGFGDSQTGNSRNNDRHVYMDNSGKLIFGTYNNQLQTVSSKASYNDGNWHQVVATLSGAGMTLYVDGAAVAKNANYTTAQNFSGYWRVGGDSLATWPSQPSSLYFKGSIDEVAIYPTALSSDTVQTHYAKSGRTATPKLASTSSVPASFSQSGDSYSISAAGTDIWVGVDQYGALYQPGAAAVNASVTAQVQSQTNTDPWAKAGVVLRNDVTGAKSSPGYAVMVATPGNGVAFQWDSNGNGDLDSFATAAPGTTAPVWVRLVRLSQTTVAGYYSTDGTNWIKVGPTATVPGAASVQDAGLVMTSHNARTTGTATFGSFKVK